VNLSEPDQNSLTWRQLASRGLLELSKTNRVLVPFVAILALLQLNIPSDLKQSVFSVKTKSRNSQALGNPHSCSCSCGSRLFSLRPLISSPVWM
jgi:hypothetical protein